MIIPLSWFNHLGKKRKKNIFATIEKGTTGLVTIEKGTMGLVTIEKGTLGSHNLLLKMQRPPATKKNLIRIKNKE